MTHVITFLSTGERLAKRAMKAATRKTGQLTMLGTMTGMAVDGTVLAGGPTGDWRFDADTHFVRLGDRFHTQIDVPKAVTMKGNDKRAAKFAATVLRHERWHGLVTVRDVNGLAKACRAGNAPFAVFNVMEDCRIEAKAFAVEGEPFYWEAWIARQFAKSPLHALLNAKMYGGASCYGQNWAGGTAPEREAVKSFYDRVVAAPDSWAVVELAIEWAKYWGEEATTAPEDLTDKGHIHDDIGEDSDGSAKGSGPIVDRPDAPSAERDHGVQINDQGEEISPVGTPTTTTKQTSWTTFVSGYNPPIAVDKPSADKLAARLGETLIAGSNQNDQQQSNNGSRLHIGNAASGNDRPFTTSGDTGTAPSLVMVMDMSGSMSGEFDQHGRTMLAAMARLLRNGDITGSVWLTGQGEHAYLPPTAPDTMISALEANKESESIAVTLDALKDILIAADVVIVYTDGMLTDGSVDAGMWRARGVDLIGALVLPTTASAGWREGRTKDMKEHFGRSIIGSTGLDLANKIIAYTANRIAEK